MSGRIDDVCCSLWQRTRLELADIGDNVEQVKDICSRRFAILALVNDGHWILERLERQRTAVTGAVFSLDDVWDTAPRKQTHKGNRWISDLPDSDRFPVDEAVCRPAACSEWVTYILSELCPILTVSLTGCRGL